MNRTVTLITRVSLVAVLTVLFSNSAMAATGDDIHVQQVASFGSSTIVGSGGVLSE